jgi:hypothetical protein
MASASQITGAKVVGLKMLDKDGAKFMLRATGHFGF